jgi:endogenous inhibitor of DNA gyrase (YacG/DUF329 family)
MKPGPNSHLYNCDQCGIEFAKSKIFQLFCSLKCKSTYFGNIWRQKRLNSIMERFRKEDEAEKTLAKYNKRGH